MLSTVPFFYRDSWIQKLSDGHAGTLQTLAIMRWLCRRDYRSSFVGWKISSILSSYRSKGLSPYQLDIEGNLTGDQSPVDPVDPLFFFARDSIRFEEDVGPNGEENFERLADFQRTTELGYGDCDDKCIWLATALLNCNIPVRFRVQSYTGRTWDHVYCECWKAWRWVPLDPTADGHTGIMAEPGWRQPLPATGMEMIYPI